MDASKVSLTEVVDAVALEVMKQEWSDHLLRPQDGMWESFRDSAVNWAIIYENEMIGYAAIDERDQLLQFYIQPRFLSRGQEIFNRLINELKIASGIVGSNNPIYLSLSLNYFSDVNVHSYLFTSSQGDKLENKEGELKKAISHDIDKIVEFYHSSMGAPKKWLLEYVSGLVKMGEIFFFKNNGKIIGTCEVRNSKSNSKYADIGMVVSPEYRKQGYGSFLLSSAAELARKNGKMPICSCEKGNHASFKAISKCGFISLFQLLSIRFKAQDSN
jgi:predicted acetyltransferase